jgi:hypothetical protein
MILNQNKEKWHIKLSTKKLELMHGDVATLALGLWPRQKGLKGVGQEECENEDSHS